MITHLTLNYIRQWWRPPGGDLSTREFCKRIFPDVFCSELCENAKNYYFNDHSGNDLSSPPYIADSTLAGLMRGNRKSNEDGTSPAGGFTKYFITGLVRNIQFSYHEHLHREPDTFRENMFHKILRAVREKASPNSAGHPLFANRDFQTFDGNCPEETKRAYGNVNHAITVLLEKESDVTISYAIFLLVVTALVQDRITDVYALYAPESIEKVFAYDLGPRLMEVPTKTYGPFTDPNYMNHEYHLYLFRESSNDLWSSGALRMEMDGLGRPTATMALGEDLSSPVSGGKSIVRTYKGTPMLSQVNQSVYLAMSDEKDAFVLLTFPYKAFNFLPMYYRRALLLSSDPKTKNPQIQKAAIVARELSADELSYVKGLLKMDSKQLLLTERQLEIFRETFKDRPWMPDFEANYLPLFESHRKVFYCFDEDEILSCSVSDLPHEDRLRVLLALKSIDPPNQKGAHKFIVCEDPNDTHVILK